jgi:hypothetical protein
MEDVKIIQKDTVLGGVLTEYDVNALRYVIDKYEETTDADYAEEEFIASLHKSQSFLKDVIIKARTV